MKLKLAEVGIDKVTLAQGVEAIQDWILKNRQAYVVTPNVEMVMLAQNDPAFLKVLNDADLAIPDSARIGWGLAIQQEKNFIKRVLKWPFFLFPTLLPDNTFPTTTGTDIMEKLVSLSSEKGFKIGLLGGEKNVAVVLSERLKERFLGVKIEFVQENLSVDQDGNHTFFEMQNLIGYQQNNTISEAREADFYDNLNSRKLDLLFVAFGHVKQEKWMAKNLPKTNVKVMLGVGGAFDYLSGQTPRAPRWLRQLGFEWLYRVILQPWRLFRFINLVKFTFLVLFNK